MGASLARAGRPDGACHHIVPARLAGLALLDWSRSGKSLCLHKHNLSDPKLKLASRKPYQWPALSEPNPFWPNRIRIMASLCQA
jgi:hypothetical protein